MVLGRGATKGLLYSPPKSRCLRVASGRFAPGTVTIDGRLPDKGFLRVVDSFFTTFPVQSNPSNRAAELVVRIGEVR